ncbi:hypothetical protein OE88DRAFT_1662109 [Heliocybe sulcata]|uniref:MYND-type domain-containing protein n=1 Tax=Heliocybe sulcata TaxID=5364 RepID=A0A5C3MX43_9AGAM|nr:hypothetical protein OE88DRAFT_1662109 [Heliocybe sulcata]
MFCELCGADAQTRCSACKHTWYCSPSCQQEDWRAHKKGCKIQQMLNVINEKDDKKEAQTRPVEGRCTGCNVKFGEEEECDQVCEDCGYRTCMDCSCSSRRGTCYCPNSNFGDYYCVRDPKWYHGNGRNGSMYTGDMHPEPDRRSYRYPDEDWEPEPRKCSNCGEVRRMLKKGAALEYARING